ncbi:putative ADP-ribosylation factor-like protein 5C isoform X3 [Eumetopias jubatus]|uniref:putative ADP-ribosylation factor-like protein 5C isoform X3 n=2 Tax=Eumetopias jubatus TaxID=34886 RepID=UPI0010169EB0|nr:putative ADP-ribosylation factor-like protein 5C isoform X3 [Eumetopias jubatus]
MGQLIAKLMGIFGNQEHKVIIVGLDNAGKTTILYQFLMNEVVHTSPTIGSNVEEIVLRKTHFLVWDIGGQEALRSTWNTYYSNTEFIILVIDSTDRDRLPTTREELYKMLAHEKPELLVQVMTPLLTHHGTPRQVTSLLSVSPSTKWGGSPNSCLMELSLCEMLLS